MSDLIFDESVILLDVEADTKESVLEIVAKNLVDKGLVKESFIPAILKRESEFATGLPTAGVSVAIPHTDVEHVNQKTISVAVLKQPVDFVIMGDDQETTPVQIIFMLAMNEAHSQLTLLQKLMQIFQDEQTLTTIANETSKTNIKKLLEEKLDLAAYEGGER
ncbi:PTS sugar transporter subunit IIA [Ornithinibacillus bavariensis]|uniref:PTS sugar transporter subunit IIA n=1 Tax=Ornithinibacillus bavariensis TaxID=545502 RepID=A0A919X6T5_9BACI|nr:PTS sugar transporter subunit IIA [Ornithinibacillus bavariensis]GIO27006.1 PTS sugar transporter subunit IIA [Ornithinibacillus bavariensis]HAM80081.1 PTS sugar transporter subunit IIA [Ornithinibacillus sp.]